MQYEEVTNRVRLAKQNGLWRETSWGGAFQEYRGQYEESEEKRREKEERRKERAANHVQWDLQANREKSIGSTIDETTGAELRIDTPARTEPLAVQQLEASPKRAAKLAKQKSKSSSQDSAQRPSPPLIPISVERNVQPPAVKRIKKEKSSDSLLSGNRSVNSNDQILLPSAPSSHSTQPKKRGDSDSPPHHKHRTHGSPKSAIRRTSVDSMAMGNYRPPPAAQNRMVQSTTSALKYSPPAGYEQRKFKIGAFPTQAFEQQYRGDDMKRSGDFGFKARGMIGMQIQGSSNNTPHVKKISITSKAPSIPY
ncbi:hypothetical protein M3Y97_00123800 [Aphelenchoides bicaudatus]|nr:hypothetical protein M3Y97_00123800 [Aphelenchoides bicaudatus]